MTFQFSTCNRNGAIEFIQTEYPNFKDEGEGKELLDFVSKDIVRITAQMHVLSVNPGTNWKDEYKDKIILLCKSIFKKENPNG
jgi:hypothetical protein